MCLTFLAHIMFPLDSVGLVSLRLWLNRGFCVRPVDVPETNKYKEQVQTTACAACSGEGM